MAQDAFKAKQGTGYLNKNNFKQEDWHDDFRCVIELADDVLERITASKHVSVGLREYKNDRGNTVRKVSVIAAKKPEAKESAKANGYQPGQDEPDSEIPF